jgi:trans-2,3-dihydro-3-hydroxyanthranilate isomerase
VAGLQPNLTALAEHERVGAYCFAGDGTQWKSRWFGPAIGIPEDPATGSAAGPLAVHLGRHGVVPFGTQIEIRQGVEMGRPSTLHARAHSEDKAEVGGSAVVVARGHYRIA